MDWIYVKDALPEISGDYITADGDESDAFVSVVTYELDKKRWIDWCSDEVDVVEDIVKWMHFPSADYVNKEKELQKNINELKFMINNGLGWNDMKNDITYPSQL